jgi:hypothetical protein
LVCSYEGRRSERWRKTVYPAARETVKFSESKDGWMMTFSLFVSSGKKKEAPCAET